MAGELVMSEETLLREIRQTPSEYWPNLLKLIQAFRESVALRPAAEAFRQGWAEARSDETLPISELWDDVESE